MSVEKRSSVESNSQSQPVNSFYAVYTIPGDDDAPQVGQAVDPNTSKYIFAKNPTSPQAPPQKVNPVFKPKQDPTKAEKLHSKGQTLFENKKYAEAAKAIYEAIQLDQSNPQYVWSFAQALFYSGDLLNARNVCNQLATMNPNFLPAIALLANADEILLSQGEMSRAKLTENDYKNPDIQKQLMFLEQLRMEYSVSKATVLVLNGPKEIEGVKTVETKFDEAHKLPPEKKKAFVQELEKQASEFATFGGLDPILFRGIMDPKFKTENLSLISSTIYGLLAKFAETDSDPALKAKAGLYKGLAAVTQYQALQLKRAQVGILSGKKRQVESERAGEKDEAKQKMLDGMIEDMKKRLDELPKEVEAFEKANGASFTEEYKASISSLREFENVFIKTLGGGDLDKGRTAFNETLDKMKNKSEELRKAVKEQKNEEAIKLNQEYQELAKTIPSDVMLTHQIVGQFDAENIRQANAIAFDYWRAENESRFNKELDEKQTVLHGLNSFFNPWADSGKEMGDRLVARSSKRDDLLRGAQKLIDTGKALTISEALTQIEKTGTDDQKSALAELGEDESSRHFVKAMIEYLSTPTPSNASETAILNAMDGLQIMGINKTQNARTYKIISIMSTDSAIRTRALASYKKIYPDEKA